MSGGKKIPIKSFSLGLGSTNKRLQQHKAEKARQEEESKAAAAAYQEFVASFENDKNKPKTFVKGGVVASGSGECEVAKRELYKPPRLEELEKRAAKATLTGVSPTPSESKPAKPGRKKDEPKKKSQLDLFLEELKIKQEKRDEHNRSKNVIKGQLVDDPKETSSSHRSLRSSNNSQLSPEHVVRTTSSNSESSVARKYHTAYDSDDPNTTNLYLSSLDPGLTEKDLCDIFGIYGPLASVKIMWPRTDEERKKNRNYGFVAFMCRRDAERAISLMQGKMVRGLEMRMSWSKAVVIPPVPYYIPPVMTHLTTPPPPSGLPFNCQPPPDKAMPIEQAQCLPDDADELHELVEASTIRVVAPSDRQLLSLIHRMVEFVVREGPLFEALVMSKEFDNPLYRFLFDFQCPAHIYYRWRLFSILQGDHPTTYRLKKFRLFEGGSWWKPPVPNPWTRGMPEHLFRKIESERQKDAKSEGDPATGKLESRQRVKLEHLVRTLTPERKRIGEVMLYCIEHAFAAEEIVDLIMDSLELSETPLFKKIARFYLVSDLVYNSSVRMPNAKFYRPAFEPLVLRMIKALNATYESIEDKETADQFRQRVLNVLKAWQNWSLYPNDFLLQMQNTFMGFDKKPLVDVDPDEDQDTSSEKDEKEKGEEPDPLIPESAPKTAQKMNLARLVGYGSDDSDQETSTSVKVSEQSQPPQAGKLKFLASKWETIDPKVVEEQAVTTSKWDMFEDDKSKDKDKDKQHPSRSGILGVLSTIGQDPDEDSDSEGSQGATEQDDVKRRAKLRDIECKVLKFQDELEKKRRNTRSEIQEQCREFRANLVRRMDDDDKTKKSTRERRGGDKQEKERDSNNRSREQNSGERNNCKKYGSDDERQDRKRERNKADRRRRSPSTTPPSSRRRSPSSPRKKSPSPYRKRSKY